jgi:hypothetical protein
MNCCQAPESTKRTVKLSENNTVIPTSEPESIAITWMSDQVRHDRGTDPLYLVHQRSLRLLLCSCVHSHSTAKTASANISSNLCLMALPRLGSGTSLNILISDSISSMVFHSTMIMCYYIIFYYYINTTGFPILLARECPHLLKQARDIGVVKRNVDSILSADGDKTRRKVYDKIL